MTPAELTSVTQLDAGLLSVVFVRAFASSSSHPITSSVAFATPMFTPGNRNSQTIESTHVDRRKLPVVQQFPGGDDVSALHPLRSSAGFGGANLGGKQYIRG